MKKLFLATGLFFASMSSLMALEVGDEAPCVVLNTINADQTEVTQCIRDFKDGQKFTVLEFASIHCSTCEKNLPALNLLKTDIEEVATLRQVFIDRDEASVRDYIQARLELFNFNVALDLDRDAKRSYDVIKTPTLFILNADNTVVYKHSGALDLDTVADIKKTVGL